MRIYKLSFKNLRRRKLRSALTLIGVIIGVIALVVLMGINSGMTSYMKDQTETMMGDVIIVNGSGGSGFMGSSSELNSKAVSKIENMSQLYNIQKVTQFTSELNGAQIVIEGIGDWNQIKINGTSGVVISKTLADDFNYGIGSEINVKGRNLTVTGITNGSSPIVFLNSTKALFMNDNKVSGIIANTNNDPNIVKNEIEITVPGTNVITKSEFSKQMDNAMGGTVPFISEIASIGLLIGIISIMSIMLVNVSERTREIGVLKAIGFTRREVLGSILTEAGLLGFTGALLGMIIAAILIQVSIIVFSEQISQAGLENLSIAHILPIWLVVGVIIGTAFLSVLASLYPAWRASRLNAVEALRHE